MEAEGIGITGPFAAIGLRALDDEQVTPADMLVLLAICSYTDKDRICWPSQETLAKRAKCSREAVNRRVKHLVSLGYLELSSGHRRSHVYRVIDTPDLSASDTPLVCSTITSDMCSRITPTIPLLNRTTLTLFPETTTQHLGNNKEPDPPPHSAEALVPKRYREGFRRVWKAHPGKGGKGFAARLWARLRPDEALVETMLAAIERQKKWRKWREGFVVHVSTWLNERRWEDEEPPQTEEEKLRHYWPTEDELDDDVKLRLKRERAKAAADAALKEKADTQRRLIREAQERRRKAEAEHGHGGV